MPIEIIPFEIKDYLEDLRSKVTMSFEDAPVFDKFLQLLVGPSLELQEAARQLMQERSVDTAVGAQLDIIGNIVGQPRELIDADLLPYFGYLGNPASESYGDINNPGKGGYYWDYTKSLTGSVILGDEQYRLFIRAKILKNITRATPEDVIRFITFVFNVSQVQITVDANAEALILVPDSINDFERVLLTHYTENKGYRSYFVPKTLGVGYNFGSFEENNFFSFVGVPGGKGYGTILESGAKYDGEFKHNGEITYSGSPGVDPGVGGVYASLYEL